MNIQKESQYEASQTPTTRTNDPVVSQRPLYIELTRLRVEKQ